MTIPHSNAGVNKTSSRSSLKLDGTLSSLITVKTHIKDPFQWSPSSNLLEKAKKATKTYTKTQVSKKTCNVTIITCYNVANIKCADQLFLLAVITA